MPSQGPRLAAALRSVFAHGAARGGSLRHQVSDRFHPNRPKEVTYAQRSRPLSLASAEVHACHHLGNRFGAIARICTDQLQRSASAPSPARDYRAESLPHKTGRHGHLCELVQGERPGFPRVHYKITQGMSMKVVPTEHIEWPPPLSRCDGEVLAAGQALSRRPHDGQLCGGATVFIPGSE